jgi:hypothetical protein
VELPKNAHKEEIMSNFEETLRYLIKALEAGNYSVNPNDLFPNTASGEALDKMASDYDAIPSRGCFHEWVEYVGLSECYSYCKKCDKKAVSDKKP